MDINEYLERLRREIDEQAQNIKLRNNAWSGQKEEESYDAGSGVRSAKTSEDVVAYCPYCGEPFPSGAGYCPYCGQQVTLNSGILDKDENYPVDASHTAGLPGGKEEKTLQRLKSAERLEESSKSRIGTFERLYMDTYFSETHIPIAYGYEQLDYAALVCLLASVLEIELNLSVYQQLRELYGIEMPLFANKPAPKKEITVYPGFVLDIGKESITLGRIQSLLESNKSKISCDLPDMPDFIEWLNAIIKMRNKADHKDRITREAFVGFYELYVRFFNRYIDGLMDLKEQYKGVERKGNKKRYTSAFSLAVKKAGEEDVDYMNSLNRSAGCDGMQKQGIIFTDTSKLALKYFGEINCRIRNEETHENRYISFVSYIKDIINCYIERCAGSGITYWLLDVADKEYGYVLEKDSCWQGYLALLDEYCKDTGITADSPFGLFIIGGDDVIPVPRVHNPISDPYDEIVQVDVLENELEADMLYAYEPACVQLDAKKDLSWKALMRGRHRFYVGRLPLEEGHIESSVENDLGEGKKADIPQGNGYFNRAFEAYRPAVSKEGILIKHRGIEVKAPLVTSCQNTVRCANEMTAGLPLAPLENIPGLVENNKFVSPLLDLSKSDKLSQVYRQAVQLSDMLIFILHGCNTARTPGYFGAPPDPRLGTPTVAFDPELFAVSNPQVVTGVCCWGARYIGYKRENSALLQALYNHTLLFVGSSRTALGSVEGPIRYSEKLLKYYLNYLLEGYDAGQALMCAKYRYFNNDRASDMESGLFLTVLEFNLFGDPLLNVCPLLERRPLTEECMRFSRIPDSEIEGRIRSYQPVYVRGNKRQESLLSEVRGLVDLNFRKIHDKISDLLYRHYQIEPRMLYTVYRYVARDGAEGYTLRYRNESGPLTIDTIVDTDLNGNGINIATSY